MSGATVQVQTQLSGCISKSCFTHEGGFSLKHKDRVKRLCKMKRWPAFGVNIFTLSFSEHLDAVLF